MKLFVICFLSILLGCSSAFPQSIETDTTEQTYNSNPPPKIICEYPKDICPRDGKVYCVNLQWDNLNCGVCGNECNVSVGDICHNFQCKSIENFGFDKDILNVGPREYNVKRDLPRPVN